MRNWSKGTAGLWLTTVGEADSVGPADVGGPAQVLKATDEYGSGIDLALIDAVTGAGGVCMVQVVPAFPHADDGKRPAIGGHVATSEWSAARDVTSS